jgi:predicted Zn-dependent peptidase
MLFEGDSVTNIAHQLGYFQTVADVAAYASLEQQLSAVTAEQVALAARRHLGPANRTVGWFSPLRG